MQLICPNCRQTISFSGQRPAFCAYCGKPLPPAAEMETAAFDGDVAPEPPDGADPSDVGGYRLLRRLGEGGMGRVYEAEDAAGRRVALKLISADFAASPAAVERFRREGRLASGVSHPRCVFVLAADEAAGRPYIVMELMPGTTLQDVVDRDGPMPVEQALSKILDVIEGLREAHRQGVVHRDVKPSNCFLDADGRVKIGDFGLSKSLVDSDALTRTGTFIGTPLFAAPEQIKGDPVGPQSDVYSTAATLYCLLTGRAPFQGGDPAATLARIVCDPAPPMRSLRRDLPAGLDKAVLRGLERDPAKRWRDLAEFQAALAPFVPGRLSIGGLGVRFGTFLIDYFFMMLLSLPLFFLTVALTGGGSPWDPHIHAGRLLVQTLAGLLIWGLYFGGCEALWGCTPGKRWLGLRVYRATGGERPGAAAVALRTSLFFLLLNLGTLALQVLMLSVQWDPSNPEQQIRVGLITLAFYPLEALGIALLLCTMRARNGYRGLHEVLSGTRVVRLPDVVRRRTLVGRHLELETSPAEGLPGRIGPFEVVGVLPRAGRGRLLVGNDAALGRRAWIWLRPADESPLSAARRDLSRTTRLRWLAGGREEGSHNESTTAAPGAPQRPAGGMESEWQWDAFLTPDGGPLAGAGRMSWSETRQLLGLLAEELAEAEAGGTLPAALGTGQVWVRPDGRVHLLDMAVGPADAPTHNSPLTLVGETALLALRGRAAERGRRTAGVGVPLPGHAIAILGRLVGAGRSYANLQEFRAALAAVADKPAETTRPRRLAHVALLTAFLSFGLCAGLAPTGFFPAGHAASLVLRIRQQEALRERLKEVHAQDQAGTQAANPVQRQTALRQLQEDERLAAELDRKLERTQREHTARLEALDGMSRTFARAIEEQMLEQVEAMEKQPAGTALALPPASKPYLVRSMVQLEASETAARDEEEGAAWVQTIMLVFWPAVWVVWAFLFRGGLSFLLMGLTLVRGNGRPALRIQCAWRALLVWTPVVGLAVASVWLDAAYWSAWPDAAAQPWMLAASSAAWWAGLALLPVYAALAVWLPRRSLHDWLAGTHVVPR